MLYSHTNMATVGIKGLTPASSVSTRRDGRLGNLIVPWPGIEPATADRKYDVRTAGPPRLTAHISRLYSFEFSRLL